jgi:hypothetical protein
MAPLLLLASILLATGDEYTAANARLARATPKYPHARLLVQEAVGGEVGTTPFEAVQRIYALDRPNTQRQALRFYASRLGSRWQRRGSACLVSGSRLVVAVVGPGGRRLGVLFDSRGARRCTALQGLIGDLVAVGYPDP